MAAGAIESQDPGRPFSEFRTEGLLWLINVSVFHPRGYALGFHFGDDGSVTGWTLLGDGNEAWTMPDRNEIDELMRRAKALLS